MNARTSFWALLMALTATLAAAPLGQAQTISIRFDSAADFEACFRDVNIEVTPDGKVQLAPSELLGATMGNKVRKTSFSPQRRGKKIITLDSTATRGDGKAGTLYVFHGTGRATFNGRQLAFRPPRTGAGWNEADIDARWLREGDNEIVFLDGFNLAMDLEQPGSRTSLVSGDGGTTWSPAEGEFLAHLRLNRHPARGQITSEVIDLANPRGEGVVAPALSVNDVRVLPVPAGEPDAAQMLRGIDIEARTGDTPRPDASWSDWGATWHPMAELMPLKPGRYVQWRVTLAAQQRDQTPVLDAVAVEARAELVADPARQNLKVAHFDAPRVVRSSYDFGHQPADSARLRQLREQFQLDQVVAPGKTEMEQFVLLRNWVRRQWPHNDAGSGKRTWDAIEILTSKGEHGMCVHYGVTYTQAALALGFNARQVILRNHYVSEIWSNEHRKWVLMDVETVQKEGWERHGTALYVDRREGVPMSGVEIHLAVADGRATDIVQMKYMTDGSAPDAATHKLYERTYDTAEYAIYEAIGFPPRNNYLDQLEPWEEFHGEDYYHSDLYLWWRDTARPLVPEYTRHTHRDSDIHWTVNTVGVSLTATDKAEAVTVAFDTVTPNLRAFMVRLDGGEWQEVRPGAGGPHDAQATMPWPLKAGKNTLEVKPRNAFGRDGVVSTVVIER